MNTLAETKSVNPAIAILGVPFDNLTTRQALALVEEMIASRQPHYFVTPNVDFLTQARYDADLRRILCDANLVLCDGTPVLWASRLLGNPLPERVAGSDMVPLLIRLAVEKNLRLFFLGGSPESMERALANLKTQYPSLNVSGYSPPYARLHEMDHDDIKRRIAEAKPDMLFVSFGCPKQEKWISMHYKTLGVPVVGGVGGTIDFLAGHLKRAPRWMQRSGTEWLFRLCQEPRRLFRRYALDMRVFALAITVQWWQMQMRGKGVPIPGLAIAQNRKKSTNQLQPLRTSSTQTISDEKLKAADQTEELVYSTAQRFTAPGPIPTWHSPALPNRLDIIAVRGELSPAAQMINRERHCLLPMQHIEFVDSTGMGWLIRLQKECRAANRQLILLNPHPSVRRALSLMRLNDHFKCAKDVDTAETLLDK